MRNGIAYNRTSTNHIIYLYLGLIILILNTTYSWGANLTTSPLINIYLKLSPKNNIQSYRDQFKQILIRDKHLANYNLKTIFDNHPLHVTLYLAQYPTKNKKLLIKKVKKLAKQFHAFPITAQHLTMTSSGYVMLEVRARPYLQYFSNTVVLSVSHLRDRLASIPSWAAHNPLKLNGFNQYGSPNVFTNYSPHFTFIAPDKTFSAEKKDELHRYLQRSVAKFNQHHPIALKTSIDTLAIGLANEQGQIIKELASFALQ